MGNNAAFTAFEATVIAVYNYGILDQKLLSELMEPYRGVDIDSGGMQGTLAKDGLDIEEIVIKTFGVVLPPAPELPEDHDQWTDGDRAVNDEYQELRAELFFDITGKHGWG
jgi:hypothetical protein